MKSEKRSGYSRGGGRRYQGQDFRSRMKPVGPESKTLIFKYCGSYRHLIAEKKAG